MAKESLLSAACGGGDRATVPRWPRAAQTGKSIPAPLGRHTHSTSMHPMSSKPIPSRITQLSKERVTWSLLIHFTARVTKKSLKSGFRIQLYRLSCKKGSEPTATNFIRFQTIIKTWPLSLSPSHISLCTHKSFLPGMLSVSTYPVKKQLWDGLAHIRGSRQ